MTQECSRPSFYQLNAEVLVMQQVCAAGVDMWVKSAAGLVCDVLKLHAPNIQMWAKRPAGLLSLLHAETPRDRRWMPRPATPWASTPPQEGAGGVWRGYSSWMSWTIHHTRMIGPNKTRYPEHGWCCSILKLLRLSLEGNDFSINNKYYLQASGTAIGKRFAPNYVDIYMAYFEAQNQPKCDKQPLVYLRYLDDIFLIWTKWDIWHQSLFQTNWFSCLTA